MAVVWLIISSKIASTFLSESASLSNETASTSVVGGASVVVAARKVPALVKLNAMLADIERAEADEGRARLCTC